MADADSRKRDMVWSMLIGAAIANPGFAEQVSKSIGHDGPPSGDMQSLLAALLSGDKPRCREWLAELLGGMHEDETALEAILRHAAADRTRRAMAVAAKNLQGDFCFSRCKDGESFVKFVREQLELVERTMSTGEE